MTARLRRVRAAGWTLLPGLVGFLLVAVPLRAGTPSSGISGVAYDDLDKDGVRDPGEPGLAGVTITFDAGPDGTVDSSRVTDGTGFYQFLVLNTTGRVLMVTPSGRVPTSPNPVDTAFVLDPTNINFGSAPASVVAVPALGKVGVAGLAALLLLAGVALLRGGFGR